MSLRLKINSCEEVLYYLNRFEKKNEIRRFQSIPNPSIQWNPFILTLGRSKIRGFLKTGFRL